VAEKEAAQKRVTRQQLDVDCQMDVGVPAVFYCYRCKKPFCEDCIGREAGRKTLCIHCASVEESIEEEAQSGVSFAFVKKKSFLFPLFAIAAIVVITFNLYTLYSDRLESDQTEAVEHEISLQLMDISECRANLEILVAEALSYHQLMGHPAASLEELSTMFDAEVKIEDPVSFEPYIIKSDDKGNITALCPTPEEHGVAGITAVPGRPARVTYANQGTQP